MGVVVVPNVLDHSDHYDKRVVDAKTFQTYPTSLACLHPKRGHEPVSGPWTDGSRGRTHS